MQHTIQNDTLSVSIKTKGAELSSVYSHANELEYMWGANPAFWGKSSPVLFPVVGALRDNKYFYNGKEYSLPRHGFAREEDFTVEKKSENNITFLQRSTISSREKYPFEFELRISYELWENTIIVTYNVTNTGNGDMYFSIGAHPAFKVPLSDDLNYSDYFLEFNQTENTGRWPISKDGLIETTTTPLLNNNRRIPLTHELFAQDALVFKHLKSDVVTLRSDKSSHGLDFHFEGFPFMGIWAAKNADFVCIEPWCGIADGVDHNQQLVNKEGIERIGASTSWSRSWTVRFF